MPSAVGYQPTLGTEMGELQERITSTKKGSITSVQAIYVPADDLTDPAVVATIREPCGRARAKLRVHRGTSDTSARHSSEKAVARPGSCWRTSRRPEALHPLFPGQFLEGAEDAVEMYYWRPQKSTPAAAQSHHAIPVHLGYPLHRGDIRVDPRTTASVTVEKSSKGYLFASATWHFSTEKLAK
jgi:hypothetical protein